MYAFVFDKRSLSVVTIGLVLISGVLLAVGFLVGQRYIQREQLPAEIVRPAQASVQALPIAAWSGNDPTVAGDFTIQAGAYSSWPNAVTRQRELQTFSPAIVQVDSGSAEGVLYLVRIGAYASREQADRSLQQIRQQRPADQNLQVRLLGTSAS